MSMMEAKGDNLSSWKFWLAAVMLATSVCAAQQAAWTVKPDWVRAHEEFLASDALAGRGSATRDEEIAATYVASEFLGYGLKTAPGMSGYLQVAEVVKPELDNKAVLTSGAGTATQGQGLSLLFATGETVRGPLRKLTAEELGKAAGLKGAVVLVTGPVKSFNAVYGPAVQAGAAAMVLEAGEATRGVEARLGGKTRVGMHLKDSPADGLTVGALSTEAEARFAAQKEGVEAVLDVHAMPQPARTTSNAIGYLPGSDPASGTILLTAHLDHLGVGRSVHGDAIYNGANDDAAGTTAVLELAHALAAGPKLRRSVLFVCYGSEEVGELGSTYFGEHPPVPLKDLVANLEFEMIGTQDPKMPKDVLLFTGWDRSNLGPVLKEHGALLGPDPYPEQHFFERSDNYALALKGVVAHTAAGWGTPPTYHQPNDDLAHLNFEFMTAAIQSLIEPLRWLAESDFRPAWKPGGQPKAR